ncbi:hypothetical protein CDG77_04000 [Nostoc sp. 'Peltigera membranacea cyanobiont' 213]|uniref:hypothetical protein n=1 Tax=Nostoc sp. TaxID=1180 RepID=UPI000B9EF657|nr:hypothetical protein CDG77_04000 [Nostoc sp. 'Peltigera membranacea cyanobiont' 213]
MQSPSQDNNYSGNSPQQPSNSSIDTTSPNNQLGNNAGIPLETVQATNNNSNLPLDLSKLIVVAIFLIVLATTFFIINRGSDVCIFSFCSETERHSSTVTSDFWAFAGGTATVFVLTTFLGLSIVPAVLISSVVWFIIYSSFHLS